MSAVNQTRIIVQHESWECKCGFNENECNWKQKWNPDEFWCECKKLENWSSCGKSYTWNLSTCDSECNRACKIDKFLDSKYCSCGKQLTRRLVLECEDEILNTTETLTNDKQETWDKNNCVIHAVSLVIIYLLLLDIVSIGCY